MGCATKVVQYLFFAFNFLFFLLGIAVIAVGIYSRVQNDTWRDLINSNTIIEAANILIAAGIIVAVIGFLGCCGACKKWNWMLISYAILVILIFILEIAAGIYAYTKRTTIQTSLTNKLKDGISKNYGKPDTASVGLTKAIDWFQKEVKCCGAAGPSDWRVSDWYKAKNISTNEVPKSCCVLQKVGCNKGMAYNSPTLHTKGCVDEGKKYAKANLWLIGGVGVGIAVVELLGIVFSILLCKTYKDDEGSTA